MLANIRMIEEKFPYEKDLYINAEIVTFSLL